ncbi:MAG: UbiA family prenyltransferase [Bdellovibrionales bacterium]|nr:UbiA family prenyltransferase [Bdellovibrionales bacterium]
METQILKRKSLGPLSAAALAIVFTGASFHPGDQLKQAFLASLVTVLLMIFVYGIDTLADRYPAQDISRNEKLTLAVILLLATITACFLPAASLISGLLILILGFSYSHSIPLKRSSNSFLLKSLFGVKNLWIGSAWGIGIYLGSGDFNSTPSFVTALFVTLQVFIGSCLRDIDDVEEDELRGIHTLPRTLGIDHTYSTLHFLNLLSGIFLLAVYPSGGHWIVMLWIPVIWRALNLEWLRRKAPGAWATQYMNLATCGVILSVRMVSYALS